MVNSIINSELIVDYFTLVRFLTGSLRILQKSIKKGEVNFRIAITTVEPAVEPFSCESEAFGSSVWRESVYLWSILTFWLFCYTVLDSFYRFWGIAQPMDAPTEVTRWDGRTYHGISIAFVIWQGQTPLNIWTCSSENCLSSLLSLLIMTQMPHFHVLSHGNR